MKLVALEEHLLTPSILDAWRTGPQEAEDHAAAGNGREPLRTRLLELGTDRIAAMDDQGVDVQVLSVTQPGVQNLPAEQATVLSREANNAIAAAVKAHPDRFEGFATLPTPDPDAAARELHRAVEELGLKGAMVFGRTGTRNADDPFHEPTWQAASALRVPIYLHPQRPQRQVADVYYRGFSEQIDSMFASGLIGWHYETGYSFCG
jgi:predicted TIM-barrel fold metal-dependent hydrolase